MSVPTYRPNTYGQVLVIDTHFDLTGQTAMRVYIRKPDVAGTVLTKTATLYGDLVDGRVQYVVESGVLDTNGEYRIEAEIEKGPSVKVRSSTSGRFVVAEAFGT